MNVKLTLFRSSRYTHSPTSVKSCSVKLTEVAWRVHRATRRDATVRRSESLTCETDNCSCRPTHGRRGDMDLAYRDHRHRNCRFFRQLPHPGCTLHREPAGTSLTIHPLRETRLYRVYSLLYSAAAYFPAKRSITLCICFVKLQMVDYDLCIITVRFISVQSLCFKSIGSNPRQ